MDYFINVPLGNVMPLAMVPTQKREGYFRSQQVVAVNCTNSHARIGLELRERPEGEFSDWRLATGRRFGGRGLISHKLLSTCTPSIPKKEYSSRSFAPKLAKW